MEILILLVGVLLGAGGVLAVHLQQRKVRDNLLAQKEEQMQHRLQSAEEKAQSANREIELKVQAERLRIQDEVENKFKEQDRELERQKRRLDKREEQLDRKFDHLDQRESEQEKRRLLLEEERKQLESTHLKLQESQHEAQKRLEEVARLSEEEAKRQLLSSFEESARRESARLFKQLEEDVKERANHTAQEVIATAIQRHASEFVAEKTVSVVPLPSEEMKGRIIGREGRNIRALEAATGCDLIIDDTPEAVVISGFNPVRRQVARLALEELIADGRIHPARIEAVVRKASKTIEQEIREAGKQAIFDVGLNEVAPEIVRLLGTLKYRTSYTQNVLAHSVDVAFFAGIMADELGLDGNLARRCGLLHDIGKALDHEIQGSHAVIGGQFAKKYKEHPIVVNAIWSHHFEIEPTSVYGPLTNAADALSAARPGARRENMESYIKRLESLEQIANQFDGVDKCFAVQAGRELRVMVSYDRVQDEGAMMLAREIAQRVENELTYPGQIKVTVIREMRVTEIAH
ncbi:MAG: ribonuclease Y [Magnetococcales bacterium]|nr:ribonuclease Y [Magnetococcales bacterium]MBF0116044.1 ribonuclease Y [Magnetococcales bacterium]